MPSQHKHSPMSLRLPEALSAWVAEEAGRSGRKPHRVVVDAVAAAAGRGEAPPGTAAELVSRATQAAAARTAAEAAECKHAYPDARVVLGVRVCRKCPGG